MKRLIKILSLPVVLVGLSAMLFTAAVHTYHRLTREAVIAEVSFRQLDDQIYQAFIRSPDQCDEEVVTLYGDQWRLDAQFVKWKYWATIFGLDSQYRLDRIEGRYRSIYDENTKQQAAYQLAPDTLLDLPGLSASLGKLNVFLDAEYGSSTYADMDAGRAWRVYRTQTGIITRPVEPESHAPGEPLEIEISGECAAPTSAWTQAAQWLDRSLSSLLSSNTDPG